MPGELHHGSPVQFGAPGIDKSEDGVVYREGRENVVNLDVRVATKGEDGAGWIIGSVRVERCYIHGGGIDEEQIRKLRRSCFQGDQGRTVDDFPRIPHLTLSGPREEID